MRSYNGTGIWTRSGSTYEGLKPAWPFTRTKRNSGSGSTYEVWNGELVSIALVKFRCMSQLGFYGAKQCAAQAALQVMPSYGELHCA
jgi:hypothetical protein